MFIIEGFSTFFFLAFGSFFISFFIGLFDAFSVDFVLALAGDFYDFFFVAFSYFSLTSVVGFAFGGVMVALAGVDLVTDVERVESGAMSLKYLDSSFFVVDFF